MIVFDASAVLAILRQEPGGDAAAGQLEGALLSSVNLSEVIARLLPEYSERSAIAAVAALGLVTVAAGEMDAVRAAAMREATKAAGLSLGDRFCLALAHRFGCPAITADRDWDKVAQAVGVEVVQIRQ